MYPHCRYYNSSIYGEQIRNGTDSIFIEYCDLQGGVDEIYGGIGGGTYENCIESTPSFKDTLNQDYRLSATSPCIDTGTSDTTGLNLSYYDLDGNARIWNDTVDMGAYEYGSNFVLANVQAFLQGPFEFRRP